MDNYLIFKNDEKQVEIDGLFHELVKLIAIPSFKLTNSSYNMLLSHIANIVIEQYPEHKTDILVGSSKVYILRKGHYLEFEQPFDFFELAIDYIADIENFNEKEEIVKNIKEIYNGAKNFIIEIFPFKIFKVDGFLAYMQDEQIYVLFFSYE